MSNLVSALKHNLDNTEENITLAMGLTCRNIQYVLLMSYLCEPALGTFALVAFDGDDVTLSCTNSQSVYPGWTGPDLTGSIIIYSYRMSPAITPKLGEKSNRLTWDTQNNKSLIIRNVIKNDSGVYTCDASLNEYEFYNVSVRVRPKKPKISNKEILDDGTKTIRGTMDQHVTLTCTSTGGFLKPKLKWFRHNNQTQNLNSNMTYVLDADGNYIVEQTYIFTPTRQDDMDMYICQSFFDSPKHFYQEDEVKLFLNLKPIALSITTYTVEEGVSTKAAVCTASQYRPNTAVFWLQIDGNDITSVPDIQITKDVTTETFTIVALFKLVLNRNKTGQSVSCHITHDTLQTPQIVTGTVTVYYAPYVEVTTTNVTVFDTAVLTCKPSGLPALYTYTNWRHTWPGHGTVTHSRTLGNHQTLTLTSLTYEHSGVYHCSASNGVNGSLNPNAGHGATFLQVHVGTFPIILTPSPIHTSTTFQTDTSVTINFYSNRRNNKIECSRNSTKFNCASFLEDVDISLPVFDSSVRAKGLAAKIFLSIQENSNFGTFTVTISNDVGASTIDVDVLESEDTQTIQAEQTPNIALILGVLGGVVAVCITVVVVVYVQRKRKSTEQTRRNTSLNRDKHQLESVKPTIADLEMEPRQGDNYNEDPNIYEELGENKNTLEYESLSTGNQGTTLSDVAYENLQIKE